jgi:urease subunit alpha
MFGAFCNTSSVSFISAAALERGLDRMLDLGKTMVAVRGTRTVKKQDLPLNGATPRIEVDPQNYQVRADGELLWCEPAAVLPMAQRYFLF